MVGGDNDSFDVGDCCLATKKADVGGETWFETELSLLSLYTLDGGSLLSRCMLQHRSECRRQRHNLNRKRLHRGTGSIRLIDGLLNVRRLLVELSTDVDVGFMPCPTTEDPSISL